MAAKKQQMLAIVDGPGMLEMQFSDYNPQGHIVTLQVDDPKKCLAPGEFREKNPRSFHCQITGSDRIERVTHDVRGWEIPPGARMIRLRSGMWPWEGWYDPVKRKGLITEAKGFRNGVPPQKS